MANTTNKFQDPRPKTISNTNGGGTFHKNRRSAIDYYGEDYLDKLLKVTKGRVLHDYVRPSFSLPRKYRR